MASKSGETFDEMHRRVLAKRAQASSGPPAPLAATPLPDLASSAGGNMAYPKQFGGGPPSAPPSASRGLTADDADASLSSSPPPFVKKSAGKPFAKKVAPVQKALMRGGRSMAGGGR